jgi:hypothetical protein
MDLHVTASMSAGGILNFLQQVWGLPNTNVTKVVSDHTNRDRLHEDYAAICSFLSHKDKVVAALQHLNDAIRVKLEEPNLSTLKNKVVAATNLSSSPTAYIDNTRDGKPFKTHKVLSGILDAAEHSAGFNGAQSTLQKLHTTAQVSGDMTNTTTFTDSQPQWQQHVPTGTDVKDLPTIGLPKGAPTLTGILKKSFNPILLKNGFHWKDPGADAVVHGEFTHRIQWYAIVKAHGNGALTLVNTPVQIFKSMGYLFAGKPNDGATAYLWELLCDCFAPDQEDSNPGKPRSNTFTCPNVLQTFLSRPVFQGQHELPYLNVLMRARYIKRSKEDDIDRGKTENLIRGGQKPVLYGITSEQDKGELGQGAIWWRKHS